MNNTRRKILDELVERLEEVKARLEEVRQDEEVSYDNLPEAFQEGSRGERMQEAISRMEDAFGSIEEAIDGLTEARE
jgi:hypothetical protein